MTLARIFTIFKRKPNVMSKKSKNFKSGSHDFMEKRGVVQLRVWSMISRKRGCFQDTTSMDILKGGVFFQKAISMDYRVAKSQMIDYNLIKVKSFGATHQRLSYIHNTFYLLVSTLNMQLDVELSPPP